jgi:hypothetical protein
VGLNEKRKLGMCGGGNTSVFVWGCIGMAFCALYSKNDENVGGVEWKLLGLTLRVLS